MNKHLRSGGRHLGPELPKVVDHFGTFRRRKAIGRQRRSSSVQETSSVSVRQRSKNRAKQWEVTKGEMPGQPANQLVVESSGSCSHG
jgi:hypothetical protein